MLLKGVTVNEKIVQIVEHKFKFDVRKDLIQKQVRTFAPVTIPKSILVYS
jgi:hypothetical protein